jgi:hypothetical protein
MDATILAHNVRAAVIDDDFVATAPQRYGDLDPGA